MLSNPDSRSGRESQATLRHITSVKLLLRRVAGVVFLLLAGAYLVPATLASDAAMFFGPAVFGRDSGKPLTERVEFSAEGFAGPYLLCVENGDADGGKRVSSARVWLNGIELLGPEAFSQDVSAHVIEVALDQQNTLEVRLASAPGSQLTIWLEGAPINVIPDVTLDVDHSASQYLNPTVGGLIETTDAQGVTYLLQVPPDAISGFDSRTVTLTPILNLAPLPEGGQFVVGVRVEAEGVRLLKPAVLTIVPPFDPPRENIYIVCYYGTEGAHYIVPCLKMETGVPALTLYLPHFSDWIAMTAEQCPEMGWPGRPIDIYFNAIGCTIKGTTSSSEWDWNQISAILTDCVTELVLPVIQAADSPESLLEAFDLALEWQEEVHVLYTDSDTPPPLNTKRLQCGEALLTGFKKEIEDLHQACIEETDPCEKLRILDRYLALYKDAMLGLALFLNDQTKLQELRSIEDFGGAGLRNTVAAIKFQSNGAPVTYDDAVAVSVEKPLKLTAIPVNFLNEPLTADVLWISGTPAVLAVDDSGVVTGLEEGMGSVQAMSLQCNIIGTVYVKVTKVASVEIVPDAKTLFVDDLLQLTVIVRDANGNELLGREVIWGAPTSDAVGLDPTMLLVTAVREGTATLTAECEGVQSPPAAFTVLEIKLTVTPSEVTVPLYEFAFIDVVFEDSSGTPLDQSLIQWTIEGDDCITFDPFYNSISGDTPGHAMLVAEYNGRTATCDVTVTDALLITLVWTENFSDSFEESYPVPVVEGTHHISSSGSYDFFVYAELLQTDSGTEVVSLQASYNESGSAADYYTGPATSHFANCWSSSGTASLNSAGVEDIRSFLSMLRFEPTPDGIQSTGGGEGDFSVSFNSTLHTWEFNGPDFGTSSSSGTGIIHPNWVNFYPGNESAGQAVEALAHGVLSITVTLSEVP